MIIPLLYQWSNWNCLCHKSFVEFRVYSEPQARGQFKQAALSKWNQRNGNAHGSRGSDSKTPIQQPTTLPRGVGHTNSTIQGSHILCCYLNWVINSQVIILAMFVTWSNSAGRIWSKKCLHWSTAHTPGGSHQDKSEGGKYHREFVCVSLIYHHSSIRQNSAFSTAQYSFRKTSSSVFWPQWSNFTSKRDAIERFSDNNSFSFCFLCILFCWVYCKFCENLNPS